LPTWTLPIRDPIEALANKARTGAVTDRERIGHFVIPGDHADLCSMQRPASYSMNRRPAALRLATNRSDGDTTMSLPIDRDAGVRLLQSQGLRGLRAALAAAASATPGGWLEFWRGYAAQFESLNLARTHWLAAEALFVRESDSEGLECVACGMVQCALLDHQTFHGFAAWAERVSAIACAADPRTALGLFRIAARVLVATERREAVDAFSNDIEEVFVALGQDLDPEIRLRTATSTVQMLGLALDRVRSEDFYQASDRLARSIPDGDYSRALWHLFVVEARFYDASWAPRLLAELDEVERLAQSAGARILLARADLLRAAIALGAGDDATARTRLDAAHRLLDPANPRDYWVYHYYSSRHALVVGEPHEARAHIEIVLRKLEQTEVPAARTTAAIMQQGFVLAALEQYEEAAAAFHRAGELSQGAQATPCFCHVHLAHALRHLHEGSHDEARAELIAGFAQARGIDLAHFFRALPRLAARLCAAAIDLDADAVYARKVIALRSLACPDRGVAQWPWPLRVRSFGGFAIERDGEPFRFGRKAPKRMLDMLRLVIALGGRHVDSGRVAAILWPDAEGDEGRDALKAMLHRARTGLGADLLAVRDGQISFDESVVWIDTWAFEHVCDRIESLLPGGAGAQHVDDGELERRRLQLFALYRGHFLGEVEVPAWAIAVQDKWRERFVHSVVLLGQRAERTGRTEGAIALYRGALEHDNLAEEIYQRLIECHIVRGENAQALNAFRRCRELLSIVLGLRPSARTEALVARIPRR
jgi:DNA-binding SARP family transcriptional activator